MTTLKTDFLSHDLPREYCALASEIVPEGSAFAEEYWNAMARQMLTGLILHVALSYPLEKRTTETLLGLVEGGVKAIDEIRASTPSGAVRAWLRPSEPEKNEHFTAAVLAECAANLHRFLLSTPQESR